jgi:carbamoyl-phosphate synthase large subunit
VTRPLNALVLGVGGNVSQSIQKALGLASLSTRVLAACISPGAPGLFVADRAFISPLARDPGFVPWLLSVCERERVDVVLSGSELVLEVLAVHAGLVRERTGAVVIVSSPEVLVTGRDKLLTCRWLESRGLPVPGYASLSDGEAVRSLVERCGFPLVAKPRFGKGSDGILTVRDERELDRVLGAEDLSLRDVVGGRVVAQDVVLQELLGDAGEEYTAGCFCDSEGVLCGTIVLRRRLRAGTTVVAELGAFPEVRDAAGAIALALGPLGPCNVQLRVHHGQPVAFDINPRFSGTTALRARMGFNEVEAALRHFVLGEPVPTLRDAGSGVALRYWNEIYVPAAALSEITNAGELADPRSHRPQIEDWGTTP